MEIMTPVEFSGITRGRSRGGFFYSGGLPEEEEFDSVVIDLVCPKTLIVGGAIWAY